MFYRSVGYRDPSLDGVVCFNITKLEEDPHYLYEVSRLNSKPIDSVRRKLHYGISELSLTPAYSDFDKGVTCLYAVSIELFV